MTLKAPQRRQDEAERPKAPDREPVAAIGSWGNGLPQQVYREHPHGELRHLHWFRIGDGHTHG